jgi:hypothetical protein
MALDPVAQVEDAPVAVAVEEAAAAESARAPPFQARDSPGRVHAPAGEVE